MVKTIEGKFIGAGKRIAIVASRFNDFLVQSLIKGAVDCLLRHGTRDADIILFRVPGAFEIPPLAHRLAGGGKFDAVICLGVVIRGATPHFEYIAAEAAKGISTTAITTGLPIIFGIVTADTIEQAIERAGTKSGNRGADAALASLEIIDLYAQADKIK